MVDRGTWKVAFKTSVGLYEFLVIPFRLANSLAPFMRLIDGILCPRLGNFIIIYLDHILIFTRTWEEHLQHVCVAFKLIQSHNL